MVSFVLGLTTVGLAAFAWRAELSKLVAALLKPRAPVTPDKPASQPENPEPPMPDAPHESFADRTVRAMVTVARLRDQLEHDQCETGVAACTVLLKAIVEHKLPTTVDT